MGAVEKASDQELVDRIQAGEKALFAVLYDRYYRPAYLLALRVLARDADAQEAAAEAFLKAYEKMSSFRQQSAFYTWLYRIVMNESLNLLRSRQRMMSSDPRNELLCHGSRRAYEGSGDDIEAQMIARERQAILRQALSELAVEDRLIIGLRFDQELNYEEISELLDMPRNTVGTRLHRAKKELARRLEERGIRE